MPDWKSLVRDRLGPLPLDAARAADIVNELAQHVAEHYADLVAAGATEREAIERALAPLADRARVATDIARADRPRPSAPAPPPSDGAGSLAGTLLQDVRYSLRLLRRSPGFAAAAIVTLALGIGANAAIFSVVRAVILRPPPYRDPSRLVAFLSSRTAAQGPITSASMPDFEDWGRQLQSFEQLGLLSGWTFNISGLALPERVYGARVTGSLFQVLGTPPLIGRTIAPADDASGGDEVVVLGYRVWQRLFAGDRGIIGRPLMMEGRPHVVIGVMPPQFRFPTDDIEMWAAIKNNMTGMPRNSRFMTAVGRLKPGVPMAAAQAELDAVTAQLEKAYPETNKGWRVRLAGVQESVVGDTRPALVALVGAVGVVLLIACANVSSLLFARAAARRRETAIRVALGAGHGRVIRQWLTENIVVSLIGGACGVALAYGAGRLVVAFGPADVPRLDETTIDGAVVGYTFIIALLAGAMPSLGPAIRAIRLSSASALAEGFGGYSTTGRGRAGAALVVVEVALAMTLAVAGALVLRSFARLTSVAPGFDPARVLTMRVFLTPPRYRTVAESKQYIARAIDRLAATPGVESAAAISQLPIADPASGQPFDIEGRPVVPADRPTAAYRAVSAAYFETVRIPITRGRGLTDDDRADSAPVVLINETMARRLWPNADPVGQRIRWATGYAAFDQTPLTIVGVVADIKSRGLDKPESMAVYAPYQQRLFPWLRWTGFVVRTQGDPRSYIRPVREQMTAVDPLQPVYQIEPLDGIVAQSVAARRFNTILIDLFAALALVLCAVGVYGTIGCWVADRAREIGVRMALGATRGGIRLMVVGRSLALTAAGVLIGVGLSALTTRMLATLLFDVRPFDIPTLVSVSLVVLVTGAAAAYIPAQRASAVDPLAVMRGEL